MRGWDLGEKKEIKNIIENLHDNIIISDVKYIAPEKYNVDYVCKKHVKKMIEQQEKQMAGK